MKKFSLGMIASVILLSQSALAAPNYVDAKHDELATPCPFDSKKSCTLQRDILNDKASDGEKYYASTNYDHRMSGEINVYRTYLVTSYSDNVNAPGQLKLGGGPNRGGNPAWFTGQIMTRHDLWKNPWNSGTHSHPWTTREAQHGYLEVVVKNAKCETSDDGLCQHTDPNKYPNNYNYGLWPSIWMEPTYDSNWPQNGEIDLMEAYEAHTDLTRSDSTIHFFGNDSRCQNNDCQYQGYHTEYQYTTPEQQYKNFHTWGFEWQPDPQSTKGGMILTGYFDNKLNWGPLRTDTLPADGPNAMARGFNDPNGGFYLIIQAAIGGPMVKDPNPHVNSIGMYIRSVKAYTVSDTPPPPPPPPPNDCLPPINVQAMWSPDKKQITLAWQRPSTSATITNYQIHNYQNKYLWRSASERIHCYSDQTLPGTSGTFTYYFYSICASGRSAAVRYDVKIP